MGAGSGSLRARPALTGSTNQQPNRPANLPTNIPTSQPTNQPAVRPVQERTKQLTKQKQPGGAEETAEEIMLGENMLVLDRVLGGWRFGGWAVGLMVVGWHALLGPAALPVASCSTGVGGGGVKELGCPGRRPCRRGAMYKKFDVQIQCKMHV
jgi:hypothetical protein